MLVQLGVLDSGIKVFDCDSNATLQQLKALNAAFLRLAKDGHEAVRALNLKRGGNMVRMRFGVSALGLQTLTKPTVYPAFGTPWRDPWSHVIAKLTDELRHFNVRLTTRERKPGFVRKVEESRVG